MTINVLLPRQFVAQSLFQQVESMFGSFEVLPEEVNFDFHQLRFVRPSGVVFLSNLANFLLRNDCRVKFSGMNPNSEPIRFLDDSLFFEQHMGHKLNEFARPRETTQPLIQVRHTESHSWIRNTFIPWLSSCSGIAPHDLSELATCLGELFNNIVDHTEFDVGCIFAQWYPQEERVIVSIADFGSGIPATVARVCNGLTDNDAIAKAFEEEFTSKSTPRNRGIGLSFLLQNVVEILNGRLDVSSAHGAVIFQKVGNSLEVVPYKGIGYCPGTLIDLEFDTSAIERTHGELEDIEW
jgi:anti-sigma regulatory factor (Ser/Thr protein kinase)